MQDQAAQTQAERANRMTMRRARAGYDAFNQSLDETQRQAMRSVGITIPEWEKLDPSVQRGWIRAAEAILSIT